MRENKLWWNKLSHHFVLYLEDGSFVLRSFFFITVVVLCGFGVA